MRRSSSRWAGVSVVWAVAVAMAISERLAGGRCSLHLLPRVVARAHQWAGFYMTVAHLEAVAAERSELVGRIVPRDRSEEHTSELQSQSNLVCRLLLEKKKKYIL